MRSASRYRLAGTSGHDASAQYVFDRLQAAGYSPRFQEFNCDAQIEREAAR